MTTSSMSGPNVGPLRKILRPAVLLLVYFVGHSVSATAAPPLQPQAPQRTTLGVPNYQEQQDALGFGWRLSPSGALVGDNRGGFTNALNMTINGNQPNFSQQQMASDGSEYVFTGWQAMRLEVSRRIRIDLKQGTLQYIETFKNPTTSLIPITLTLHTRLGSPAQSVMSDQGTGVSGALGAKDTGFLALAQPNFGAPSSVFYLNSADSKIRPSVTPQNNFQLVVNYSVSVPANKTVSIVHGIAQRSVPASPDAKALAAIFRPFKDIGWPHGVPSELRRTIINGNSSGGVDFGEGAELNDALSDLGAARGPHDQLLLGIDTRLRGTLVCDGLEVETAIGPQKVALEKVAAIMGGNQRVRSMRLVLRDGQVLVGRVSATGLKFTLNSGLDVTCDLGKVDRFVMREQPGDGQPGPEVFAYIDLPEGDRLAVKQGEQQKLTAITAWGAVTVPLSDLQIWSISGPSQGTAAHRIMLRDGTTFSAFVENTILKLDTAQHGVRQFTVLEINRLRSAYDRHSKVDRSQPLAPHVTLVGENMFVGQTELPLLHFLAQGQEIPVAPTHIKVLRRHAAGGGEDQHFQAELWDGDIVLGTLRETQLPIRSAVGLLQVPTSDLIELRVPTPTVPESLRQRITDLLADLGNKEWARRESASKELLSLGHVTTEQCQQTLKETSDPEVRKRVQAVLDATK